MAGDGIPNMAPRWGWELGGRNPINIAPLRGWPNKKITGARAGHVSGQWGRAGPPASLITVVFSVSTFTCAVVIFLT